MLEPVKKEEKDEKKTFWTSSEADSDELLKKFRNYDV
jgi:hypothetical protein